MHKPAVGLVLLALATSSSLAATVSVSTTATLTSPDRFAAFGSVTTGESPASHVEDGLRFSVDDALWGDLHKYVSGSVPGPSFEDGYFYPNGGAPSMMSVSAVDGALFSVIEFTVGSGYSTHATRGYTYVQFELWNEGLLLETGYQQVALGSYLSISLPDGFDTVLLGVYGSLASPATRTGDQSLAVGEFAAVLHAAGVAAPAPAAAPLAAVGLAALQVRRRR